MSCTIAAASVGRETVRLRIERDRFSAGGLDRAEVRARSTRVRGSGLHVTPILGLDMFGDPSRARGASAASTRGELGAYQPAETGVAGRRVHDELGLDRRPAPPRVPWICGPLNQFFAETIHQMLVPPRTTANGDDRVVEVAER